MNFQTAQAIRTSKVEVNVDGRTARPVVLTMQTNRWGDKHWYRVLHDGTCFGEFVDDSTAALAKYEAIKRGAALMLEVQRGYA